jgi:hypothetical protein
MLIALYRSEIESLRYSLTEKEKELSELRRSSIAPYKKLWIIFLFFKFIFLSLLRG